MTETNTLTVIDLENIGTACPSQWKGRTDDGMYVYIRYRYGELTVSLEGKQIWDKSVGDGLDGVLSTRELMFHLPGWIRVAS